MKATLRQRGGARPRSGLARLLGRNETGAVAIELVAIAPVILLILVAMMDFGMLFYLQMQVNYSAQAGARYALKYQWDGVGSNISSVVVNATNSSLITASPAPSEACGCATASSVTFTGYTCTSTCSNGYTVGSYVTVNALAKYHFMVGWPGFSNPVSLSSTIIVRVQ